MKVGDIAKRRKKEKDYARKEEMNKLDKAIFSRRNQDPGLLRIDNFFFVTRKILIYYPFNLKPISSSAIQYFQMICRHQRSIVQLCWKSEPVPI